MILRKLKPELQQADTTMSESADKQATRRKGSETVIVTRKPSERFMRRTLEAKSRCSRSDRLRLADLANKLEKDVSNKGTVNEREKFNGYRPGHAGPPG